MTGIQTKKHPKKEALVKKTKIQNPERRKERRPKKKCSSIINAVHIAAFPRCVSEAIALEKKCWKLDDTVLRLGDVQ